MMLLYYHLPQSYSPHTWNNLKICAWDRGENVEALNIKFNEVLSIQLNLKIIGWGGKGLWFSDNFGGQSHSSISSAP